MPLDAAADPFDALGAGTAPQAPAAAASPAPRVGPASIQLPQVAGSVPLGNGEYGIGQGAAPVASDDGVIDVMGAHEVPAAAPPPKPAAAHADPFDALGAGTKPPSGVVPVTPTASPNPTAVPPARSGYIANIGAGTSEAVAGLLGMPVDTVTAIANLVPRGINAVAGTNLPTIDRPAGGSEDFKQLFGVVGANPNDVVSATPGEALARAGARGAAVVALPGGIARGFVGPAAQALAAGGGVGGAAAGAGGGVTGYAASKSVPPEYAPLADTLGNIVGGGLTAAGEAAVNAFWRIGTKAFQAMQQPMNLGAREPLIDPATGQPFPNGPTTATAGQQTLAGRQIVAASGQTPAELSAAIPPTADATLVPGSRPSLGQATGNLGVLGLERQQRNLNRTPYTEAEAANSVARVRALQGLAGPQEAGAAAGQFFAERLAHLRVLEDALERSAADTARRVTHQIGGNPAETGEQELGAAHRAALEALRGPVKAAAGRLYDAIDPDGTLALRVTAVRDAARKMLGEVNTRMGGALSPAEADVIWAAAGMRDVELFSDLRALDSNLSTAQRAIRTDPKLGAESQAFRRISTLRAAIDDAMAEGAGEEAAADAAAAKGGSDKPTAGARLAGEAEGAPGAGTSVFTPSGREIGVRYRVVEGDDLVTSHDDDLKVNPKYPAELQPRDRARLASQAQVQRIAANVQPERLGASSSAMEGAPIIGPGGVVESGNARVLGLRRAYAADGDSAARYRAWLQSQGYNVAGMKNPVLVRERTTPLSEADRVRFTQEANASPGLSMSAGERAAVDAQRMPDSILDLWRPGEVDSAANRDFVRAFAREVPEAGEGGDFFTAEGGLSLAGAQRIRNALLHKAYGDANLVSALSETGDETIKAFGGALMDAAGDFAKLRAAIAAGHVDPSVDLTPKLLDAARVVSEAKQRRISIKDAVGQRDMLAGSLDPLVESILRAAYGENLTGRISRGKLADLLSFYAEEAPKQTATPRLFGENASPSEILATGQTRGANSSVRSTDISGRAGGYGPSAGANGSEARGPVNGASGQANAATAEVIAPEVGSAELQPNFSPEDRAALRAANRAYADYKNTFRRGAVGDVLASATGPTGFRMAESGVPKALFRGGPQGSEAADSLIRAAGSPEAAVKLLGDYPAFAFRRAAETDGMIDPGKAAKWLDANKAALDKLPGLREKFADAAKAGAAVEKAAADGADRIKAMQDSAARHYLTKGGEAVEPQAAVGKLLASPTAPKDAAAMMRTAERAGNQAAIDGIKRNLVDYLLTKARSTAEAGTTGEKEIAGGVFQRWIANPSNAGVVRAVLGPEGADMVAKVAEDIERAARAVNATKIPGSPGTAADLISHAAGGHGLSVLGQVLVGQIAGEMIEGGVGGMELGGAMAGAMMALNAMRLAGMRNVDDLATAGLLNPELGRLLISKAVIADKPAILKTLLNRIAAVGVGASSAKGKN